MKTASAWVLPLAVVLLAIGCARQDAASSAMSYEQKNALSASLAKLEDTLRTCFEIA
jgi:hypothetical protein